jgi:hypothetical protein
LAFACSVSLGEMRDVTTGVGGIPPFIRTIATCASCRRQTLTLSRSVPTVDEKCAHCSRRIEPADDVEVIDTDRFHRHCWTLLTSAASVRSAKILSRQSQELIRRSRQLRRVKPPEETSADDA